MRVLAAVIIPAVSAGVSAAGSAQPVNRSGESVFQRSYSCHLVNKRDAGLSGSCLDRLLGRAVASDPDFAYSKAFKDFAKRHPRWTRPLLDRFLANPDQLVPGNEMGFFGLDDGEERAAIIAYLAADK